MFTNRFGIAGKVIAGTASDTGQPVAWIVSDAHAPNLQNMTEWLQRFNGQNVRITLEYDVEL